MPTHTESHLTGHGPTDAFACVAAHLIEHGLVSTALLARAAEVAAATGEPVHHALVRLGLIGEAELAKAFAACLGLPLARPTDYPALPVEHPALPPRFLEAHRLLPLALDEHRLTLAMADPLDGFAVRALAMATGRQAEVRVAVPAELEAAFKEAFGTTDATEAKLAPDSPAAVQEDDVGRLRDLAREAPVVRLVDRLLLRAVEARASDVHIEPHGVGLRVRYRIDGDLEPVEPPPAHLRAAVISRLKIMAGLDIAERRLPQDGRIRLTAKGRAIDLRVSTIPFQEGEGVVLRLLDKGALVLDLDALGYAGDGLARLRRMIAQPNGIVLVTGPTGSGKTSTLYAALGERMSPAIKLVTVEDPVEYELPGINQIQVKPAIGLTFANALRAILRHDPDVIMVGEIRDLETAQIAIQAALTGHLVLSTVHTNSAAATITRLLEMGLEDYLLAATINGVVAQRLVRRLCPHCREPQEMAPGLVERLAGRSSLSPSERSFCRPTGCPQCRGGYLGRVAITEVLELSEPIRQAIMRKASAQEVEAIAAEAGMQTLLEDGLGKAAAALTSIDEVLSIVRST